MNGHFQRGLSSAQKDRDAAITRIARVRRATVLGAAALTAGLAGLVSAVAPGRSLAKLSHGTLTAPASSSRSAAERMPRLQSPGQLGLQAPGAAPQAPQSAAPQPSQAAPVAPQPAPAPSGGVVSGGS